MSLNQWYDTFLMKIQVIGIVLFLSAVHVAMNEGSTYPQVFAPSSFFILKPSTLLSSSSKGPDISASPQ